MGDRLQPVQTARMTLIPASAEALRADLVGREALSAALGVPVPSDWPHQHWDPPAVNWLLDKLEAYPDEPFWRAWFAIRRDAPLLIGGCGFKGPPDAEGFVEVGYGIVESHRRRGLASEATAAMVEWARQEPRVRGVCAHTLAGDPASGGVLRRCGFTYVRSLDDPNDGRIDRYELKAQVCPETSRV